MKKYKCADCGAVRLPDEVEDSRGQQVDFKCPNGCGETVELEEDDES